MKIVNDSIKQALKKKTTQRKGRILVNEQYYEVYNVEYYADSYEDGNVIGNAIASQLDFDLPYMEKFDSFKYFDGIWTGNEYEYIDMGTFNVFDEQDKDEFTKHITSFDNLIKFNVPMQDDDNYPKTLFEELQNICNQAGVELENTSIANGDFIIENNQFVGGENLKSVLKAICGVSGNYAIIKDDKLKLQLFNKTDEVITRAEHKPMDWKRKTYGINQVILGMSDVTGEYVIKQDDEDIEQNGVHKLVINDNFFAYTQDKRQQLIDELFEKVKGFGYIPYEMQNEWLSYLEIGDTLTIDDNETIVLRINGKSPNAIESSMSAPAIIDSAVEFVDNTETIKKLQKRTEIIVDKNSGNITNLTNNFTSIQDNLNNNYYTIEQSNQLIQNAETGVTNTFSEAGGNNIFRNTGLWFESEENLVKEDEFENNQIIIQNGLEKPIEELKIKGKSEQETRSGKNLYNASIENMTTNGLTKYANLQELYLNGTATIENRYMFGGTKLSPGTYTLNLELKSGTMSDVPFYLYTNTTWNNVGYIRLNESNNFKNHMTFTLEEETTISIAPYVTTAYTFNKTYINYQIVNGSNADYDFEPYGASPSPDYPSEIKNIEGIENLFDKDNYLTIDGFINASTYTIQTATNNQKSTYIKVKPNTQYYISDFVFNSAIVVGSFTDVPKVGDVATNYVIKNASTTDLTITTGANDNYLVFMISNASSTTDTSKMQISKGSKKKPYVPYGRYLKIDNSSKNILNITPEVREANGLTFTKNEDGSITINGTSTAGTFCNINTSYTDDTIKQFFTIEKGKTYTSYLKNNVPGLSMTTRTQSQNTNLFVITSGKEISSKLYTGETDEKAFTYLYAGSGTTFNNLTVYPMIVEGEYTLDTIGEYESYREDEITYVNLEKENLFDGQLELGYYNDNGEKAPTNETYRNVNIIKVEPNTTYTLLKNGINQKYCLYYYDSSKTFISYIYSLTTGTFTTPDNCYYINFRSFAADFTSDYENLKIKLIKGSSSKDYYDLCSINDVEDELEVVSGKGVKKIGEVILNGSENWSYVNNYDSGIYRFNIKTLGNKANCKVLSNLLKQISYDTTKEGIYVHTSNNNDISIFILGSRLSDISTTTLALSSFKTLLSENNLQLQYELATPEEFTLEPKQINTRYGYNNIKLIEDIITNISIKFQQGGNYEFWNGTVLKAKNDKSSNSTALLLQDGILTQEQIVANGNYTVSFKYKKLIELAECKVRINDAEYILDSLEDKEFITGTKNEDGEFIIQPLKIDSGHINIQFITDTNNSCEIYDLMVNAGSVKLAYSQNQNETTTDTVNISKGITITSTNTDTTFRANADGIRTFDKNDNILTEFTDTGMITKKQVVEDEAEIVGVLVQRVGNQTWFTKI